ncbi:phosphocarrier protein FPr [Deinobacterium chartae]|uniref:phosphoenolpyruvate--protein phosphotransferase n=1 Tax=Deinobacterium chartae TaxID=521158 RepID=A0A841I2B8_9DEIO|nr:phosphoenolpyruvate--protein phosphotransferase [Deinobacterium chartae]MBB6099206.1 phosphocarrier protein FPr [Deinobacterium chartae]
MIRLPAHLVRLAATPRDKDEAIAQVAQLLVDAGNVPPDYVQGMLRREHTANTYLGNGVAIPHGVPEDKDLIRETGIAVLQVPQGVSWTEAGEAARLIVGIAARSDEHLEVLRRLTRVLADPAQVDELTRTADPARIIEALTGERAAATPAAPAVSTLPYRTELRLPNPAGMHARPATQLAQLVKAHGGRVQLSYGGALADASSMMSVLQLGLPAGATFELSADDPATLQALRDAVAAGLGDDLSAPASAQAPERVAPAWEPQRVSATIEGVPASGGLVVGVTRQHRTERLQVSDEGVSDPALEATRLDAAIAAARQDLHDLAREVGESLGRERAAIFEAHAALLEDEAVIQDTVRRILDGHSVAWAYQAVMNERIAQLQRLDDPNLAARAADLGDVQGRVLRKLLGLPEPQLTSGQPVVLIAHDLTPSDTATLDPGSVLGFCTAVGGPTSHTAIIARGLGLPAIVAAGEGVLNIPDGTPCILDGASGRLYLEPSEADRLEAAARREQAERDQAAAREARHQPATTRDGHRVEVAANINRASDAASALEAGAEGVGLMRTEFLFLERDSIPSEEEQEREYRAMAESLAGRPLIIRTLDIGGDKEVPYLGLAREDNSFLGMRGIRLCFERPDLFVPQLRAIYRAARHGDVRIMFPMISTLEDFRRAKGIAEAVRAELGAPQVPLGIMVEVPSAALLAEEFAREVDFFSIGTNDLTQYTLAMDRLHPQLARQTDALHPAVLRMIDTTVRAAQRHGRWVGVCGGAAGEPLGALLLSGLGVHELSVSVPQVPAVKAALREHSMTELRELAARALTCASAAEVRALV